MTVGLLVHPHTAQTRLLRARLERLAPGAAVIFDLSLPPEEPVALDADGVRWSGMALSSLSALYVHGFRHEDPVVPAADPDCDWSLWQPGPVIDQQKHSFVFSALSRLEAAGLRLFNPPSAHLRAFARPALLDACRGAVALPAMVCTSDAAAAAAFCDGRPVVVWRTVTGRSPWQVFGPKQRQHLFGPDRPPVLLAEVAPGPMVRAFFLEGAVTLLLDGSAPVWGKVERLEAFRGLDESGLERGLAALGAALAGAGLRWVQALVVAAPDGPVLYDLDPDPVITDLPDVPAGFLADRLAAALLDVAPPAPPPALAEMAERPALFLRRMLRIQFEMEATKHRD